MRSLKEFGRFLEGALHRSPRRGECLEELSSFLSQGISLGSIDEEVRGRTERALTDLCGLHARVVKFSITYPFGEMNRPLFFQGQASWISERAWSAALAKAHEVEMETKFSAWLSVLLDREMEVLHGHRELQIATEYLYFHEDSELAQITRKRFKSLLEPNLPRDAQHAIVDLAFRSASLAIAYWLTYESLEEQEDLTFLRRRDGLRGLAHAIMDDGIYPMYKSREGSNRFVFLSLE